MPGSWLVKIFPWSLYNRTLLDLFSYYQMKKIISTTTFLSFAMHVTYDYVCSLHTFQLWTATITLHKYVQLPL